MTDVDLDRAEVLAAMFDRLGASTWGRDARDLLRGLIARVRELEARPVLIDDHQVCDEQLATLAWAGDDLIDVLVNHPGTRAADEAITAWRKLAKASRAVPGA